MTSLTSMTSDVYMASKIHNWDVLDIQNGFVANSSFCELNDLGGLNSLGGHVDLNGLISSECCNTKLSDTKMTYSAPFMWHIS